MRAVLLIVLSSGNPTAIVFGNRHLDPMALLEVRLIIASLALLVIRKVVHAPWMPIRRRDWIRIVFWSVLGFGVSLPLIFYGIRLSYASHVGVIFALNPIFVALLAHRFLNERTRLRQLVGLVVSIAGLVVINIHNGGSVNTRTMAGDLLIMAGKR